MYSVMMKRFIDSIDDRIYRIDGTTVSFNLIDDMRTEIQHIMIDIRSSKDGNLICRVHISSKDNCSNAFMIESINPITNLFEKPIIIGCLYSVNIANRIFKEVQNYTTEWFKIKDDGK
jgi:hypothetical protein